MTVKSINVQTGEITIRERTSEEKAALPTTKQITDNELENVRIERNSLLMESDWTQSRDVTLSNDTDWKKYRQELRDITKDFTSAKDVVWAKKPS